MTYCTPLNVYHDPLLCEGQKKEVSGVFKKLYHTLMIYWATYFTSFPIPDVCLCQGFGADPDNLIRPGGS